MVRYGAALVAQLTKGVLQMKTKSFVAAAVVAAVAGLAVLPSAGAAGYVPTTLTTPATGTSLAVMARNHQWLCPVDIAPGVPIPPALMVLKNGNTPWVSGTTINIADIGDAVVPGSVKMKHNFSIRKTATTRILKGNGIPNHAIGQFPIPTTSAAYPYYAALPAQGYANAAEIPVQPYDLSLTVPLNPKVLPEPTCLSTLIIGVVSQTGAAWHAEVAPDSSNNLYNPSSALPTDKCWGHPYVNQYHYHGYSWKCFPNQGKKGEPSPLFGYAADGFGVYGPYSEGKRGSAVAGSTQKPITNAQLDVCHGHSGWIKWDGKLKYMYHYHTNNEYPYTIGCLRGKIGKMSMAMMHDPHL